MKYGAGDKFVIEIRAVGSGTYEINGFKKLFAESLLDELDRLDGDYVNEHFGELQDEAFEEGKKAGIDETLKWSEQNEDNSYKEGFNDAIELIDKILYIKETTGKAMDIRNILDELRKV